jgi:hypothetical protein
LTEPIRHDTWPAFWGELVERIESIDLMSRSANKFDGLTKWLAYQWNLGSDDVVCKYVQHSKNRWNRLREASRRGPVGIVLLFEGEECGDVETKVAETAVVCPSLQFVVVLTRLDGPTWRVGAVLYRESTTPPPLLSPGCATTIPIAFTVDMMRPGAQQLPPACKGASGRLVSALQSLGTTGDDPDSPHRALVGQALSDLTGQPLERLAFKTIPSSKNVGNRLGEALARTPAVLVVICPEMLGDRVVEEVERWDTCRGLPVILILCGEEIRVEVNGPDDELVNRLRSALRGPDDRPEPVARLAEAPAADRGQGLEDWRTWSYEQWNGRLIKYCLRDPGGDREPVERLAATPEELAVIVGTTHGQADEVAKTFVDACLTNIPPGRSFCGYCGSDLGRRRASEVPWAPEAEEVPYFFAMLWLTCLVAYGYPDAEGGFYDRMWGLIGNADHLQCLPDLWWEVAEWTLRRSEAGDDLRLLSLPPKDDFRTTIGESHFLAFPHRHDRRQLARVLVEGDLIGFEPPISPVVSRLQSERKRFSPLFCEDLDNFVSKFIDGGRDPRDSAFWRAVRQEALQPSYNAGASTSSRSTTSILGVFDDDGFLPLLGCSKEWSPPPGYGVQQLDNPISDFEHYAVAEEGGVKAVHEVMFESMGLLGLGPRALINQGVLVFQEDQSDEFFLVSGHAISGADLALVRDDLIRPFLDAFGGSAEPSRIRGWSEVTSCTVRPLDEPPLGLEAVVQLQRTMSPPTPRLIGGIQVPGGYLGIQGFLPRVKAPDAAVVQVRVDARLHDCTQTAENEWCLPPGLLSSLPVRCDIVASWTYADGIVRASERVLHLQSATVDDDFRPLGAGHFFLESCRPGQKSISGGNRLSLGVTTDDGGSSIDLIDYEPSARFMGPGHGELSTEPSSGFDWLAVGHKNRPELLLFVGDPESPSGPADRRSPAAGDRRHWGAAFAKAGEMRVRGPDGIYHDLDDFPDLSALRRQMIRHRPSPNAPVCDATRLETLQLEPPHRCRPFDDTLTVADALAALSARRSGLQYRTVQQLLQELTGVQDYALHHELIRAWAESGAFDLVRSQSYSSTKIIARRPRFVAVRRGPLIEASLIGLVTRARAAEVNRNARELGVVQHEIQPGCPWQPTIFRLRATEAVVRDIGKRSGLAELEWLAWPRDARVPEHLRVDLLDQELWTDAPPGGFDLAKVWDWGAGEFRRGGPTRPEGVQLELRVQRESCSIYVVLVDGSPRLWTHVRNWALLAAHVFAGRPPFALYRSGWLTMTGHSPVHLPLPLGRLCAILGEGVAGPMIDARTQHVVGYCYPYGRRLTSLMREVIPATWLKEEVT